MREAGPRRLREALEEVGLGRVREARLGWLSSLHLIFFNRKQEKKKRKKEGGLGNEVGLADKFLGLTKYKCSERIEKAKIKRFKFKLI